MKQETTSQQLKLGIFVILGVLTFVIAIYYIGSKQNIFGKTVSISAHFNNVNGLQPGNNVRYSGINVGTVRNIYMLNDTLIRVDMAVEEKIIPHIKKNAVATISSDGLVGSMIVNIIPGEGKGPSIEAGDYIRSYSRVRTDDILNTLNVTNENAALLTVDLLKITKEITGGKGTIGTLLNDTIMAADMRQTLSNLNKASTEASKVLANANQIMTSLANKNNVIGVVNDTAVAHKIRNMAANLEQATKDINATVLTLNETILNAKEGKGVINYLSNDPKLVKQIDSTVTRINSASQKLDENMKALQQNFLFRGYFKKLEKNKK